MAYCHRSQETIKTGQNKLRLPARSALAGGRENLVVAFMTLALLGLGGYSMTVMQPWVPVTVHEEKWGGRQNECRLSQKKKNNKRAIR